MFFNRRDKKTAAAVRILSNPHSQKSMNALTYSAETTATASPAAANPDLPDLQDRRAAQAPEAVPVLPGLAELPAPPGLPDLPDLPALLHRLFTHNIRNLFGVEYVNR